MLLSAYLPLDHLQQDPIGARFTTISYNSNARFGGGAIDVALVMEEVGRKLVGPYSILIYRRLHAPKDQRKQIGLSSVIMPIISVASIFYCAVLADQRYLEKYQSWSNIIDSLLGFFAVWIVTHAIIYLAAYLFGIAKRGPIVSRTHLVSSALILGFSLI